MSAPSPKGLRDGDPSASVSDTPLESGVPGTSGWALHAYASVDEGCSDPRVLCVCWFVDDYNNDGRRHSNWSAFALSNTGQSRLAQARNDHIAANTATGITA